MPKPKKSRELCSGCRDNFYNGNNDLGINECWCFEDSNVVKKKKVDINQRPPWDQGAIWVLSCCRMKGYVFVGPDQIN